MAIVSINYDCGCGYHARTVEEAIKHVDDSKHTLNVAGSVRSSEQKVRKASLSVSASPRPYRRPAVVAPLEVPAEDEVGFGKLRAKLQKK